MAVFISYTQPDAGAVRTLTNDLERVHRSVWLDHQISGGQDWWQEIIHQIQGAEVFLFALSDHSWRSRPCRIELDYAKQLGVPVVPIQVGPLENPRIEIAQLQIIDYRTRSSDAVIELIRVVTECSARPRQLPDPLPAPPEMPFEYLYRIEGLMNVQTIQPEVQEKLIDELRQKLKTEDDEGARDHAVMLLKQLRRREKDLTISHAAEIDEILSHATAQTPTSPLTDGRTSSGNASSFRKERPPGPWWQDPPVHRGPTLKEQGVAPEWLTNLINTGADMQPETATTVRDGARPFPPPSDPPVQVREWWTEQPPPESPDTPAPQWTPSPDEPQPASRPAATDEPPPTPRTTPPAEQATPVTPSALATGSRQRILWALAIVVLLILIVLVATR